MGNVPASDEVLVKEIVEAVRNCWHKREGAQFKIHNGESLICSGQFESFFMGALTHVRVYFTRNSSHLVDLFLKTAKQAGMKCIKKENPKRPQLPYYILVTKVRE